MKEAEIDVEIEDVLSSIRRLVSQESRPARVQRLALMQPVAPAPVEEECLILTPAQRIEAEEPDIVEELSRLETSIAEMEAAVTEAEHDLADETEEAMSQFSEVPAVVAEELAPEASLDAPPEEEASAEAAETDSIVTAEATGFALAEDVSAPVVDVDAGLSAEADVAEEETPALEEDAAISTEDSSEPVDEQAEEDSYVEVGTGEREATRIVRPDRFRRLHRPVDDDPAPLFDDGSGSQDNEEALRILVAQLIREELRGVLGERITHNVRKLVRREIQRALAGHELE